MREIYEIADLIVPGHDNVFVNPAIGRYPAIEEDEPAIARLMSEA